MRNDTLLGVMNSLRTMPDSEWTSFEIRVNEDFDPEYVESGCRRARLLMIASVILLLLSAWTGSAVGLIIFSALSVITITSPTVAREILIHRGYSNFSHGSF